MRPREAGGGFPSRIVPKNFDKLFIRVPLVQTSLCNPEVTRKMQPIAALSAEENGGEEEVVDEDWSEDEEWGEEDEYSDEEEW